VIITNDGKEIPAIIAASPIISENRIAGIRGVIIDISDQKNLELALRESELRFRELAELVPQFIFETDRNFRFTYYNVGAMNVTGYSFEDFRQGLDIFFLVDIADRRYIRESFARILTGEDMPPFQIPLMRKDRDKLPVIIYAAAIVRENEYAGIRGIIVDISDQKRLETALAITNKKLNLMNNVTRHDVLNTITGLLGLVDMLGEIKRDNNAQVLITEIHDLIIKIKEAARI
jgi:PAS domain S-box-containing protein